MLFLGTYLDLHSGQNISKFSLQNWKNLKKNRKKILVEKVTIMLSFTCVMLTNHFLEKFVNFGA